jgi:hypothetical protein
MTMHVAIIRPARHILSSPFMHEISVDIAHVLLPGGG